MYSSLNLLKIIGIVLQVRVFDSKQQAKGKVAVCYAAHLKTEISSVANEIRSDEGCT